MLIHALTHTETLLIPAQQRDNLKLFNKVILCFSIDFFLFRHVAETLALFPSKIH